MKSIDYQLEILRNFIKQHIDSNFVYLDFPGYFNVGDNFIAMGAFKLLNELPYRCDYISSITNFNPTKISATHIIIMQGGGNFGDLYPGANWFRNKIVQDFPNNKIIFFPQTITYVNDSLISQDAMICAKHSNLHICARDAKSYNILKKYFSNPIYLVPDTAIGLYPDLQRYNSKQYSSPYTLLLQRKDFEKSSTSLDVQYTTKADWDDVLNSKQWHLIIIVYKIIKRINKYFFANKFKIINDHYLIHYIYPYI